MSSSTKKNPYKRDSMNDTDDAKPLDFTFKKWDTLEGISGNEKPREGRVGKPPNRAPSGKFLTKGIWLNNNCLTDLGGIEQFVKNVLEFPEQLSWIDLSFNSIKEIDSVITNFQNLTIVYFHGNAIDNMESAYLLRNLKKLKRLTLHGNPIAETDGYRNILIHYIPQLQNLDFAPVLPAERLDPIPTSVAKKFAREMTPAY